MMVSPSAPGGDQQRGGSAKVGREHGRAAQRRLSVDGGVRPSILMFAPMRTISWRGMKRFFEDISVITTFLWLA